MPKAVVCRELGPPESLRLETFASVPLAPGQVRVAIRAAGINFPDILMAAGEYQLKPPLPFTPGVEAAGDVIEVNGAELAELGDVPAEDDLAVLQGELRAGDVALHLFAIERAPANDERGEFFLREGDGNGRGRRPAGGGRMAMVFGVLR